MMHLFYIVALYCTVVFAIDLNHVASVDSAYLESKTNATAFAIIWGYPLLAYAKLAQPLLAAIGSNTFLHSQALSGANATTVVRPNVDTVYSAAIIDLSEGDVELTVPPMPDGRFYVFPFYDLYGNNFVNIGSANNSHPGKYLLRRKTCDKGVEILKKTSSRYQGIVNFPTTYGSVVLRILLLNNGSDINTVKTIQNQTSLSVVKRQHDPKPTAPKLSLQLLETSLSGNPASIPPGSLNESVTTQLLNLTARLYPFNLPENSSDISRVTALLHKAGLKDGQYTRPDGVNMNQANQIVNTTVSSTVSNPSQYIQYGNGWVSFLPSISGDFHSAYAIRAFVAYGLYLELQSYEAIYPEYIGPSNKITTDPLLSVTANGAIIFTFSRKPPVKGFWSLTAYGEDGFLVPNPFNIYSLGDRSNLTYPDGTRVYGNASTAAVDGTFQLLMQPADRVPPANWTANWLPVPSGGGSFQINLRYYVAGEEIVEGEYVQPVVTMREVIV